MIKVKENTEILEKRKEVEQAIEEENTLRKQDQILSERLARAQENIINLEEESQRLKEERPSLLVDCKDVSCLNKRLKKLKKKLI